MEVTREMLRRYLIKHAETRYRTVSEANIALRWGANVYYNKFTRQTSNHPLENSQAAGQ